MKATHYVHKITLCMGLVLVIPNTMMAMESDIKSDAMKSKELDRNKPKNKNQKLRKLTKKRRQEKHAPDDDALRLNRKRIRRELEKQIRKHRMLTRRWQAKQYVDDDVFISLTELEASFDDSDYLADDGDSQTDDPLAEELLFKQIEGQMETIDRALFGQTSCCGNINNLIKLLKANPQWVTLKQNGKTLFDYASVAHFGGALLTNILRDTAAEQFETDTPVSVDGDTNEIAADELILLSDLETILWQMEKHVDPMERYI